MASLAQRTCVLRALIRASEDPENHSRPIWTPSLIPGQAAVCWLVKRPPWGSGQFSPQAQLVDLAIRFVRLSCRFKPSVQLRAARSNVTWIRKSLAQLRLRGGRRHEIGMTATSRMP